MKWNIKTVYKERNKICYPGALRNNELFNNVN